MQTKLRLSHLFFVACLLSFSSMPAQSRPEGKPTIHYLGVASWYGVQHQGKKMANGQRFDRKKLTAASWYFPLGTRLQVINLENGKVVQVTITDRGPNTRLHRVLDLSEAAARNLDYIGQGLTSVFLSPIVPASSQQSDANGRLSETHFGSVPEGPSATVLSARAVLP